MNYVKKFITLIALVFLIIPKGYSQETEPSDTSQSFQNFAGEYSEAIEWLQGKGILEQWFTDGFLPLYDEFMKDEYTQVTTLASVIGGLMALIYLSFLGWQFLSGERQWEILPILRPFALALVIMNWGPFVNLVKSPFVSMQKSMYENYSVHQDELNALRLERFVLQQKTMDAIYEMEADYSTVLDEQKEERNKIIEYAEQAYSSLISPIQNLKTRLSATFNMALTGLVELLALWLLRLAVYAIFFIQIMIQTILIILGPLAVGFSILPAFSNSFVSWLQKFINVSLYGFIAFIILKLGVAIQMFALESEIVRYKQMIPDDGPINEALLIAFTSQGITSFGMVIISFLMTAIGMTLVPKMADYVVGSGGQNSAMIRGATSTVAMAAGGKVGKLGKMGKM